MVIRPGRAPIRSSGGAYRAAIAFLRSLGTNAHVWIPGASGVSVASLPSNNYLLSDGSTGYSTTDGVVGLGLDAMGSLSSTELITNGTNLVTTTGWTAQGSATLSVVSGALRVTNGATAFGYSSQAFTTVVGKTYYIPAFYVGAVPANTNNYHIGPSPGVPSDVSGGNAALPKFFVASQTTSYISVFAGSNTAGNYTDYNNISCKEYTGTHLSQPTTASKPLVRRGMLNELLNSATPATQSVTCIAAPYTLALYGTGNVVLSGTGAGTLTGTGAADLVVLNFTPAAGSVTFTKAGTVSSFGLFKGTWTAAQLLAEGGIPTTTATAASNPSAGKYWWSLDGVNDSLLSGNLGITNACTITIAGVVNSLAADTKIFAEDTAGVEIYITTTGAIAFSKNGSANLVTTPAGVVVIGVPFVITCRLASGTAVVRKNGVQSATAASATTFTATTGARVGASFGGGQPLNGGLGWVVPSAVGLSDADCLTVERLAGSNFPGMATF